MIQTVKKDRKLNKYLHCTFEDSELQIDVEPTLSEKDYIGIKMDDYYMGQHLGGETPKAVDFLVVVDCYCKWYCLYIMELKHVKDPNKISTKDIFEKFDTAINRFMKDEFAYIFLNPKFI